MTQETINSLYARYPQFAGSSQPEELMLELVNDVQLLAWPEFRAACGAQDLDDDTWCDVASEAMNPPSFAEVWVPAMLAHKGAH